MIPLLLAGAAGLALGSSSKGGGSSQPTSQTVTQTNLPDYARPYVEDMLGRSQALTTQNPYRAYGGPRVAEATGLQALSYARAGQMRPAGELGTAGSLAGEAAQRARTSSQYSPGSFGAVGPATTGTNRWDAKAAQTYMNPYMQGVVDIQKREAAHQSNMQGARDNAGAVGAGAFGGTRHALVQAERERNLGMLQNDIQAQGANAAWQQAQGMFTSDQGRALQSAQGNQNAWTNYGQQHLQAQQLGEQSRQFGANMGMQGVQHMLGAANTMQGIGQSRYNQELGIAGLQNQMGTQQQATNQMGLDARYQDWENERMWPYKQLEFHNNMLRGNYSPGTSTTMYEQGPSAISQIAGLGTAAMGAKQLGMFAKGGVVDVESREVDDDEGAGGIAELLISQIN